MDQSDRQVPQEQKPRFSRRWWKVAIGAALLLLALGAATAFAFMRSQSAFEPPKAILEQAKFPIYIPKKLPGTYTIDPDSYTFEEEVVLFRAKDSAGGVIAITEQKKPANFNYDNFYATNFKGPKTINGTKYPTVLGSRSIGRAKLLSIVTDKTWIMVSTTSPVGDSLDEIAASLKEYSK